MPSVVLDTNVLIDSVFRRDEEHQKAAIALFLRAREGEIAIVLPQFVVFEAIFVLQSVYDLVPHAITPLIRDAIALPGVTVIDDCPWSQFFEHWSDLKPAVIDAAILAVAIANRYTLATFDHKLSNRARTFGITLYW